MTLKSTLAFSSLFMMVWLAFIFLGAAYLDAPNTADGNPNVGLTRAGGVFGMIAAFIAWYNMLAGIMEPSNSFFAVPVVHFPWSEKGRAQRRKSVDEGSIV
jgi:succinate-acetate transporter protein